MITTFYPPYSFGGDGIFVRELSRLLVEAGHQVRVIHCEDSYRLNAGARAHDLPAHYFDEGIEVFRLKSRWGWVSPLLTQQLGHPRIKVGQLRECLAAEFDVVNFHNISLIGGPHILSMVDAPVKLLTLHEHWLICATHVLWKNGNKPCDGRTCLRCCLRSGIPPQLWRYLGTVRHALKNMDMLLAPSEFTARQHQKIFDDLPIRVLPLFSRLESRLTAAPRENRFGKFLYVGRVTESKGVRELVAQFAQLPHFDLTIAGSGDLLPELRHHYQAFPNIVFAGSLGDEELARLYAEASALVMPSLAPETFGLAVVEAMAFGTPAIVRDAGGCAEWIAATGAGFIYREAAELPGILHKLATDPGLRDRLSCRARAGHASFFTADGYLDGYLNLISDIRKGSGQPVNLV